TLALVSRAPLARIESFRKRMGWTLPWYSSFGSDFNYDFHVTSDETVVPVEYNYQNKAQLVAKGEAHFTHGESHGVSVFVRDGHNIYHTYSTYARGLDLLLGTYNYLDLTPLGRQEDWEEPRGRSNSALLAWVRHHDHYAESRTSAATDCSNRRIEDDRTAQPHDRHGSRQTGSRALLHGNSRPVGSHALRPVHGRHVGQRCEPRFRRDTGQDRTAALRLSGERR